MLSAMRRHSQSFLIYLIFGAIIVVFAINFGPGSSSCRSTGSAANYAATVNGDIISQQDFVMTYGHEFDRLRRNVSRSSPNESFTEEMAEQMGLKRQVLDELIDRKLIAQQAKRLGITVSDDELVKHLQTHYGVKDVSYQQYESWVQRTFESTVARFEQEARDEIAGDKLAQFLGDTLYVGDEELKSDFTHEHDRVMVQYVKFSEDTVRPPVPAAAAVDELLAKEAAKVKERYLADLSQYRTPKKVHGREIVMKLPAKATDADVARIRGKLLSLKDQIHGGADFAALAKANSQDPKTADKGGDLGELTASEMPSAVGEAAFSLKAGDLTPEPVRTADALHLVQVVKVVEPQDRPFDEVKRQVATTMVVDRAKATAAQAEADAFLAKMKTGAKIEKLTVAESAKGTAAKLPVRYETPWILHDPEGGVPRIGSSPELLAAVFTLSPSHPLLDKTFKVGDAYYVIALKERESADLAKFEETKSKLREQAIWVKRTRVLREWLTSLRQQAAVELNSALFATRKRA